MLKMNKILFPTDFSESANAALGWALLLAKNLEAELHMFHAVVLHSDDVGEDAYSRFPDLAKVVDTLQQNADTRLEQTLEDSGRLTVHQKVRRGFSAVDEILSYAEEQNVDLIVMGTHGRRGISHLLLGSVTEKVVRSARCPIMTIRNREDGEEIVDIGRILLPTDFSEHSKQAARYAIVLAKILGARLDVIHVIDDSVHPAFYAAGIESLTKLDSELRERVEKLIEDFMQECHAQIEYNAIVAEGKPEAEITKRADGEKNTLIVIASHGAGALERLLLGSTTERVIRMAGSPVLTVKRGERDFVK